MAQKIVSKNKKAFHDYHIDQTLEAGMVLSGAEVKSLRAAKVNLKDGYALVKDGQVYLYNVHISPYSFATTMLQEPLRVRKLLLHKREILKLFAHTQIKGNTLPVLRAYWNNGHIKMEIGVGKGKTHGDQREALKEKAVKMEAQRVVASFNKRGRA